MDTKQLIANLREYLDSSEGSQLTHSARWDIQSLIKKLTLQNVPSLNESFTKG